MPSQNAIIGDEDFGTNIPQTDVSDEALKLEKNLAKFSKSKEFEALRNHFEERIKYYQQTLPDGRNMEDRTRIPTPEEWVIANTVIAEFKAVLDTYDNAAQVVKEAQAKK